MASLLKAVSRRFRAWRGHAAVSPEEASPSPQSPANAAETAAERATPGADASQDNSDVAPSPFLQSPGFSELPDPSRRNMRIRNSGVVSTLPCLNEAMEFLEPVANPTSRSLLSNKVPTLQFTGLKPSSAKGLAAVWKRRQLSYQLCGVVRHTERADSIYAFFGGEGMRWTQTEDFLRWPLDPPLSDLGQEQARQIGITIKDRADALGSTIHVVVSSPFLRCVQTAAHICQQLGPSTRLILDHSLGEVHGPSIMGPSEPVYLLRPVDEALAFCDDLGVQCESAVLGRKADWPESVAWARERFATAFLLYLNRANQARRNFLLVTHGDGVGATLAITPTEAGGCHRVEKVDFGGTMLLSRPTPSPWRSPGAGTSAGAMLSRSLQGLVKTMNPAGRLRSGGKTAASQSLNELDVLPSPQHGGFQPNAQEQLCAVPEGASDGDEDPETEDMNLCEQPWTKQLSLPCAEGRPMPCGHGAPSPIVESDEAPLQREKKREKLADIKFFGRWQVNLLNISVGPSKQVSLSKRLLKLVGRSKLTEQSMKKLLEGNLPQTALEGPEGGRDEALLPQQRNLSMTLMSNLSLGPATLLFGGNDTLERLCCPSPNLTRQLQEDDLGLPFQRSVSGTSGSGSQRHGALDPSQLEPAPRLPTEEFKDDQDAMLAQPGELLARPSQARRVLSRRNTFTSSLTTVQEPDGGELSATGSAMASATGTRLPAEVLAEELPSQTEQKGVLDPCHDQAGENSPSAKAGQSSPSAKALMLPPLKRPPQIQRREGSSQTQSPSHLGGAGSPVAGGLGNLDSSRQDLPAILLSRPCYGEASEPEVPATPTPRVESVASSFLAGLSEGECPPTAISGLSTSSAGGSFVGSVVPTSESLTLTSSKLMQRRANRQPVLAKIQAKLGATDSRDAGEAVK